MHDAHLLFARHTAGASWKTLAPRDVQGGACGATKSPSTVRASLQK
ncbi:MAG: hypothetical protein LBG31_03505 [Prevotellaceae bacterium]|nr:hypothetical protein [Prevotellaceae bacterium]